MKFTCSKTVLTEALQTVQLAVSNKSTIPALSNFLMETNKEKDFVKLSATDLEIGIRCHMESKIAQEGAISIPAKKLLEIVRELPDMDITLSSSEANRVTISCGKSVFRIIGIPKEEFPILPDVKDTKNLSLPATIIKEMIAKTSFAMSTDETRYVLNGILLEVTEKEVKMVATDGRRLAYISKENVGGKIAPASIIMPSKAITGVLHLLETTKSDKVDINIGSNQIAFICGDTLFISRLIEGEFPNYDQVIPKKPSTKVKVNTKNILQVTRRMSVLVTEQSIPMKFTFGKKLLKLMVTSPNIGDAEDEIDIEYDGEIIEIAFNPAFVLAVLKEVTAEEVVFELSGALTPGVLRPADDNNYVCVVMPMRLQ
ncbi:MAG: DNA polymerase III subunit beta [Elusimicrobiota bacterium]